MKAIDKKLAKLTLPESERNTMLKILLGMAIDGYGYVPSQARNLATGNKKNSIRARLQSVGLDVNEDTIRKYLTEAKNLFSTTKHRNM